MNVNFENINISIKDTPIQSIILLCFNKKEELTLNEILNITKLESPLICKELKKLSSENGLLLTDSKSCKFNENSIFRINTSYNGNIKDFTIGFVEDLISSPLMGHDNHYYLDAKIIRFLKRKKQAMIREIIDHIRKEVIFDHLLPFTPSHTTILERIHNLIEREFIERDARNLIKYIP